MSDSILEKLNADLKKVKLILMHNMNKDLKRKRVYGHGLFWSRGTLNQKEWHSTDCLKGDNYLKALLKTLSFPP